MSNRAIRRLSRARPAVEGAGVSLHRAFGFGDTSETDPFLLLDDFRGDHPGDYLAGFPWHPHRGIETITYMLAGEVEHGDSLGNRGLLGPGDVQWMTAGSGIIHQEMPRGDPEGRMYGFQLWANLPASLKMTAPRYQDVKAQQIPVVAGDDGASVRVVCGRFRGVAGPVAGIAADPLYLDVTLPPGCRMSLPVQTGHHCFAYVFAGDGTFGNASGPLLPAARETSAPGPWPSAEAENRSLVIFENGDEVQARAWQDGMRFLLVAGRPLGEPVAWQGPIVMNTRQELQQAFDELRQGTFLK